MGRSQRGGVGGRVNSGLGWNAIELVAILFYAHPWAGTLRNCCSFALSTHQSFAFY